MVIARKKKDLKLEGVLMKFLFGLYSSNKYWSNKLLSHAQFIIFNLLIQFNHMCNIEIIEQKYAFLFFHKNNALSYDEAMTVVSAFFE